MATRLRLRNRLVIVGARRPRYARAVAVVLADLVVGRHTGLHPRERIVIRAVNQWRHGGRAGLFAAPPMVLPGKVCPVACAASAASNREDKAFVCGFAVAAGPDAAADLAMPSLPDSQEVP